MATAATGSPPIIRALDHVVIAVRSLDAAVAAYETLLGRAPVWRAEAHGGGATVVAFALANVAVELMAPAGDGETATRLRAVLDAQGDGLASLAFATADLDRAHRRLARLGLEPEPIADGESIDATTGGRGGRRPPPGGGAPGPRRRARLGLDPQPIADGESIDATTGGRRRFRRTRAATARTHGVRIFLMEQ